MNLLSICLFPEVTVGVVKWIFCYKEGILMETDPFPAIVKSVFDCPVSGVSWFTYSIKPYSVIFFTNLFLWVPGLTGPKFFASQTRNSASHMGPRWIINFVYRYESGPFIEANFENITLAYLLILHSTKKLTGQKGAQWLSGWVLDSRLKGRGFEPHRLHCVVVLEQDTFILA